MKRQRALFPLIVAFLATILPQCGDGNSQDLAKSLATPASPIEVTGRANENETDVVPVEPPNPTGSKGEGGPRTPTSVCSPKEANALLGIVDSEDLILALTPELKKLAKSLVNLRLPDHHSHELFAKHVEVRDLRPNGKPTTSDELASVEISTVEWPVSPSPRRTASERLRLWSPLLETVHYFEHAKFYFIRGDFTDPEHSRFQADMGFVGMAMTRGNDRISVEAHQAVVFEKREVQTMAEDEWRIVGWEQDDLTCRSRSTTLFTEVVDRLLPNKELRERARTSLMKEYIVAFGTDENFEWPTKYFSPHAADRHPGIAVVDIDSDGWDDLYIMARYGKNILLKNGGDGTFVDIAPAVGLDVENHCSGAIFADFDNDGDPDLMLGRTLERSRYYRNEGGMFVDKSKDLVSLDLPYLVSSITATDYNGDGLLDIYFATFGADVWQRQVTTYTKLRQGNRRIEAQLSKEEIEAYEKGRYLSDFLPDEQAKELFDITSVSHIFMGRPGPPNVLLVNKGKGRFELSPQSKTLASWRNTFQAIWADYDADGDPDIYLANDFAPNQFYRNDDGEFIDITDETRTADLGFGMGASFGDYDLDGRQDLYVTNMYSKAGRRITSQIDDIDRRIVGMARGNSLFRNLGPGFTKVSGLEAPALKVEKGGWGWGSQFLDVDNDTYLDIYALSGNYTPPKEIAVVFDT